MSLDLDTMGNNHKKLLREIENLQDLDSIQIAPKALASFLANRVNCPNVYLEFMIDSFAAYWIEKYTLNKLNESYEIIINKNYNEESPFYFNDLDNIAFFIPSKRFKAIGFTCQNYNLLYIWEDKEIKNLHIRRYYDVYDPKDDWNEENLKFKQLAEKEGVFAAIKYSDVAEYYADDYKNTYPKRLSLGKFKELMELYPKDCQNPTVYWDCRDIGYVLSYESIYSKCDKVINTWAYAWHAISLDVDTMHTCLTEECNE